MARRWRSTGFANCRARSSARPWSRSYMLWFRGCPHDRSDDGSHDALACCDRRHPLRLRRRPGWPQGWFYLGEIAFCSSRLSLAGPLTIRRFSNCALLRRFIPIRSPGTAFRGLAGVLFIGVDWCSSPSMRAASRWSHVSLWVQAVGALLIGLCMVLVWQAFPLQQLCRPQVRVQTGRAHRVITDGPYRIVRHPMYAGAVLYLIGMPLLLGSWWGLLCVPLLITGLALRAIGEGECCVANSPATTPCPADQGTGSFRVSGSKRGHALSGPPPVRISGMSWPCARI